MIHSEPSARTTQLLAFRSAAVTLWGTPAWQQILDRLPQEARDALVVDGLVVAVGWVLERHLVALAEAVFDGPAHGNADIYREFVARVIALGFGRVRRMLVQFAAPATVLKRAPELWRHDHTHGALTVEIEDKRAIVHVAHDVLTATPISRTTAAEMFRAIIALTRAKDVREDHVLEKDGRLMVTLRWA